MKGDIWAICDSDVEYARGFFGFLNQKINYDTEVILFTTVDHLLAYLEKDKVQVLFLGEAYQSLSLQNVDTIVALKEQPVEDAEMSIYKYQSMKYIFDQIQGILGKEKNMPMRNTFVTAEREVKMIGVFSPENSALKSLLALAVGQAYAVRKKTLFINFELFSCFYSEMEQQKQFGVSDLIYYLSHPNDHLLEDLHKTICRWNSLDCIAAVQHYSDLMEMNIEQILQLIELIQNADAYDVLVLSVDFMNVTSFQLLEHCDEIYMPQSDNVLASVKEQSFYRMLQLEHKEALRERIRTVTLPEQLLQQDVYSLVNSPEVGQLVEPAIA